MVNKGFTIIELLCAIAILSILSLITIPLINGSLNHARDNLRSIQRQQLIKALKNYYAEHINEFNDIDNVSCKSILFLKESGYLSIDFKNPKDSKNVNDELDVCVKKDGEKIIYYIDGAEA